MRDPVEYARSIEGNVERGVLRLRNGLKFVAGTNHTPVGTTPKDVVWSSGKAELWRYRSDNITQSTPVVIVYSLLSRSYVFDLRSGNSFVERLRDEGFDVYLLDWGIADELDANTPLSTYVDDRLPAALRAAAEESGVDDVIALGYCFGGTLTLLALAGPAELPVSGFISMAAPVDFTELGLFTSLFGPDGRLTPEDLIDDTGNVPPEASRDVFRLMKPTSEISAYVNLWQNLWNDEFMVGYTAMNQWTKDHVPFPGAAFRQTIRLCFKENAIVEGSARVGGHPRDTTAVRCPVLLIDAEHDHIVPSASSEAILPIVGSDDVEHVRLPFGHVGLIAGGAAAKRTLPAIIDWLQRHMSVSAAGSEM